MRVGIRRRGGIAGNVAVGVELNTAELPDGARIESALEQLPWGRAPEPGRPDGFSYELRLLDDERRGAAVLGEGELEADLAPLREHLERFGSLEPPRRPPRG